MIKKKTQTKDYKYTFRKWNYTSNIMFGWKLKKGSHGKQI